MAVGKGTTESVVSRISNLGANTLFISPGFTQTSGVRTAFGSANTLTQEDAAAILANVNNVEYVAPSSSTNVQAIAGNQNVRATVTGVTPNYQEVYSVTMAEGNFITADDYNSTARIAVLGATVATTLFPDSDPVGQSVKINSYSYKVIGVLASKGSTALGSEDDQILAPITTVQARTTSGS